MTTEHASLTLDYEVLYKALNQIRQNIKEKRGIFANGFKSYLPQWNLPNELEFSPQQTETKNPYKAALYLWTRAFCDRLSQSRFLMKKTKQAWEDPKKRWIFSPRQVIKKSPEATSYTLNSYFHYGLHVSKKVSSGQAYKNNMKRLLDCYAGDPRKIIKEKTVKDAADEMKIFEGINTLSNLVLVEFIDRKIAFPLDPENALFKIDRHKSRIPINIRAVNPTEGKEIIHHHALISPLEEAYLEYCHSKNLTIEEMVNLDAALWIIGSEGCAKQNYTYCSRICPLFEKYCYSNVRFEGRRKLNGKNPKNKGCFIVYQDGKRTETRRNFGQTDLFSI